MEHKKKVLKIITLGDCGVGKTSIINNFLGKKFGDKSCITNGLDLKEVMFENESTYLHIWDTYGQERFYSVGPVYYRGSDCYMLCFDIHNEESFKNLDKWREDMILCGCSGNIPFVLLGTKGDITKTNESISKERVEEWCKNIENQGVMEKVYYFETSAKLSKNINEAYRVAAKLALGHHESQDIPRITVRPPEKVETCC
ncbi:hypothetical protein ACTA71_000229 [Dictyostelium dimigraforme]